MDKTNSITDESLQNLDDFIARMKDEDARELLSAIADTIRAPSPNKWVYPSEEEFATLFHEEMLAFAEIIIDGRWGKEKENNESHWRWSLEMVSELVHSSQDPYVLHDPQSEGVPYVYSGYADSIFLTPDVIERIESEGIGGNDVEGVHAKLCGYPWDKKAIKLANQREEEAGQITYDQEESGDYLVAIPDEWQTAFTAWLHAYHDWLPDAIADAKTVSGGGSITQEQSREWGELAWRLAYVTQEGAGAMLHCARSTKVRRILESQYSLEERGWQLLAADAKSTVLPAHWDTQFASVPNPDDYESVAEVIGRDDFDWVGMVNMAVFYCGCMHAAHLETALALHDNDIQKALDEITN